MKQHEGAGIAVDESGRWAGLTTIITVVAVTAFGVVAVAISALVVFLHVGGLD